jgi:NAD(P)H dehydrogenase (quinone)
MIVVTGATGQLGRLVIQSLLQRVAASEIVAAVRTPSRAADLLALGVTVREADYSRPETLAPAFAGADRVLLISSTNMGVRVAEHKAVVDAAKAAGVKLMAYTSVLRADTSTLLVAPDHRATEQYLAGSGLAWVFLRNGWYQENRTVGLDGVVARGVIAGCSGDGRTAAATRGEYAEAAAAVLTTPGHEGKAYELGGDEAFTMREFAAEVSRQAGREVAYEDLPESEYQGILVGAGLPEPVAHVIADSDTKARQGQLYTESKDLSRLIGRRTAPLSEAIAAALRRN